MRNSYRILIVRGFVPTSLNSENIQGLMRAPRPTITAMQPESRIRRSTSYRVRMSPFPITGEEAEEEVDATFEIASQSAGLRYLSEDVDGSQTYARAIYSEDERDLSRASEKDLKIVSQEDPKGNQNHHLLS